MYFFATFLMGVFVILSLPVFNQGEEGTSWYIILKGSVNVVIYGKVRSLYYCSYFSNITWISKQIQPGKTFSVGLM